MPNKPMTIFALPLRFWLLTIVVSGSILALRFGLGTTKLFGVNVGGIAPYIGAVGTLYAILVAFSIYVVWNQYSGAQSAVESEVNDLRDLFRYAVYLRDADALQRLRTTTIDYAQSVADEEWPAMGTGKASSRAREKFERIFAAVHSVQFDEERDAYVWSEMIRKFEDVSDSRTRRLELAAATVPLLLRILLYIVSLALLSGFLMLGIENDLLAIIATVAITAIVFLVLEVIQDLDEPYGGQWFLNPQAFRELPSRLASISEAATRIE